MEGEIYFLFGRYSAAALKGISSSRTKRASKIIEEYRGKIHSMYALLGEYDLILIATLPDRESAMKASVALGKATGIAFSTSPAVSVDRFDKMVARL